MDLDELDRPYVVEAEPGRSTRRMVVPARFKQMSPEQRAGWPTRETRRWAWRRAPSLLVALAAAVVAWLATGSVAIGIGGLGLALDVVGVWLLTEGLLMTDDETRNIGTLGRNEFGYLLAQRDRRHATIALGIVAAGFALQFVGLVLSA